MVFCQNPNFKKIDKLINDGENFNTIKILKSIQSKKLKKNELAKTYYYLGKAFGNENINDSCFHYFMKSEKLYTELQDIPNAMELKLELAYSLSVENIKYNTVKKYYEDYIAYAEDKNNPKLMTKGYNKMASFLMVNEPKEARNYFSKALKANQITKDENDYSRIIFNLGGFYCLNPKFKDSALFYYQKALLISQKNNDTYLTCANLMNQADVFKSKKQYAKAIELLSQAQNIPIKIYAKNMKSRIHMYLALNYEALGDYHKAYDEMTEFQKTNNDELFDKQNKQITYLQDRYEFKEKQLENLNLRVKNKNNLLLIYLIIGLLIIVSIFGYLRINFLHKKKKIAEQEKQIEAQKLANVLKEHELKEIDKLIEGQEKERIKIANDLHDNLGSLMATLKLNFQNLKRNSHTTQEEEDQLFDKTDALLDEAYQKIRGIAHSKNAGVIANEGLLTAIMNMAKKATVPGRLNVEVVPFGLDERLENTIELNIFRMIQEILANAIKHANATEISINLTQHHDSLNIIIEDNGKGFTPKNIDKKEGMGLPNIEKKVEHMGGTFTIDSTQGKGTSIIIDIPL